MVIGANANPTGQMDPHTILARNAEATGRPPMWPSSFASGYWQCKNRYATQSEILNISAEFKARQIAVSLIVIDDDPAFSPHIGDWRLNPIDWPDPKGPATCVPVCARTRTRTHTHART